MSSYCRLFNVFYYYFSHIELKDVNRYEGICLNTDPVLCGKTVKSKHMTTTQNWVLPLLHHQVDCNCSYLTQNHPAEGC